MPRPAPPRTTRFERFAVAGLLLALAAQSVTAMVHLSTTSDETSHLPAGYTYWKTGDYRLNPQHPPLAKLLAGAALLPLSPKLDLDDPGWTSEPVDEWGFGWRFLYENDAERLLFLGRLPIVGLALLLAFYTWRMARDAYGREAGLGALALAAFSPTVIAHSHLVTMDVALAAFTVAACHTARRLVVDRERAYAVGRAVLLGLFVGCALASKFSGVLVAASIGGVVALYAAVDRRFKEGAVALAACVATAACVVWATYGFGDVGAYVDGLLRVNADHDPDYPYYLLGEFREGGFPHYFLFAFLFKTPLPTLLLLAALPFSARRADRARPADAEAPRRVAPFVWVPIAVVFVVTSWKASPIGVRYLLPCYPLLFVAISRLAPLVRASTMARGAAAALAVGYVASAIAIHPHYLSFFNVAVGGPSNGHELLDDSNIDWGQGLVELREWQVEHGDAPLALLWKWNGAPAYWGVRHRTVSNREWASAPPPPGTYAVATHVLIRGRAFARAAGVPTDWIDRYEPVDRIGYHTWIFRFPPPSPRAPGAGSGNR